jgi:hypothetical protein
MACTAKAALNSEVHLLPLEVAFKADAPRCRYPENKYKKKRSNKKKTLAGVGRGFQSGCSPL